MHIRNTLAASCAALLAAGCLSNPVKMGDESAKTTATGAAAGATASNANPQLERCDQPLGTMALLEDETSDWYRYLTRDLRLTSTQPLLRLLVQQSNCFIVVERGRGFTQMQRERALEATGELRQGSNFGRGQMVSADYGMTPSIIFSQRDAGGIGGALGGFGIGGAVAAGIIGSMKFREAQTMLTLVDNRSGVQVAVSEGSAAKTDFGAAGAIFGGGAAGGLGGYQNTAEGKVIAGAFTDAYNQMVRAVRNYRPQTVSNPGGPGTGGALQVQGGAPAPTAPAAPQRRAPAGSTPK